MSHNFVTSKRGRTGRTAFSLTDEIAIYRRVEAGESKSSIAEEKGVHRNTIANICDRLSELDRQGKLPAA